MNSLVTILVIDDNVDDRELCSRVLKKVLGDRLRLVEAGSGERGLQAIEEHAPDCVLLDYSLPGHNGIEVLRRIRAKHAHLPVIMLTGQGNEAVAVMSMKEGAQDYIAKSAIAPEALQRIIQTAIEHSFLQKRIYEQRTALEIFTRALAHDLKEPVRTIRSFLDLITDWESLNPQSRQAFEYIRKAAERMDALIESVYLYTRLDSADERERSECALDGVIEDAKDNLAALIAERGATITHDPLPVVKAHPVHLTQLIQNFLSNAIRHSETPVTVHIRTEDMDDHWQIAISDDGPGIPPDYLHDIFTPFKRLTHRRDDRSGLGLGLSINRKIVELEGGRIWCESEPGHGATFFFTLPKAPAAPAIIRTTVAPETSDDAPSNGANPLLARILMVDDSEADLVLNRIMLIEATKLHCDLLTARDGAEALLRLREAEQAGNPVDLVLLDINMPGMNGFEFLSNMNFFEPARPEVVMCTTSSDESDRRKALSLGASGYMTKPPRFPALQDIIARNPRLRLSQDGAGLVLVRAA